MSACSERSTSRRDAGRGLKRLGVRGPLFNFTFGSVFYEFRAAHRKVGQLVDSEELGNRIAAGKPAGCGRVRRHRPRLSPVERTQQHEHH
jgi:hypothetical protein